MTALRTFFTMGLCLAAGCASSPRLDAQWADPQLAGQSLRGTKVLVACEAYEPVIKRICQDHMASELVARGATPVLGPDVVNPTPGRPVPDDLYLPAARAAGAKAVLAATVTLADSRVSPGFSIGLGAFGFGSGHVGGGVGVSAPIGGGQVTSAYSASSRLTDTGSGRLLWTAKATSAPSGDLNAQMAELAKAVLAAAERAGVF